MVTDVCLDCPECFVDGKRKLLLLIFQFCNPKCLHIPSHAENLGFISSSTQVISFVAGIILSFSALEIYI